MARFIGIDLGTSFVKGAVLDLDTLSIGPARRVPSPPPLAGRQPGRIEFCADGFLSVTRQLLQELLAEAPDGAGVLVSGQMGGLVLMAENSEALTPYISWQDRRLLEPHPAGAGTYYDAFVTRLALGDWQDLGREIRPGAQLSLLYWLKETGQLSHQRATAATLPDFVLARLCDAPPATHPTQAAGAFNVRRGERPHALCDRFGLGTVCWPALHELPQAVGELTVGSKRLRCYPPVGDHPCAVAGTCLDFDELSLNLATGSQVSRRALEATAGDAQVIPFFDGQFLHRVSNLPAGRALNAWVRLLSELAEAQQLPLADPWPYIAQAAALAPESGLRADLAFFPTPVGDTGSLTHIREDDLTVGQLFRAAFENMAENYYASALRLSPTQSWRTLVFSGGVAQKLEFLRRVVAAKFQRPYRVCAVAEDTLQGLLVLALVAGGGARSVQEAMQLMRLRHPPPPTGAKSG